MHDYVRAPPATQDITRRSLSWGFGAYAENAQLAKWMHDYNRHARAAEHYSSTASI